MTPTMAVLRVYIQRRLFWLVYMYMGFFALLPLVIVIGSRGAPRYAPAMAALAATLLGFFVSAVHVEALGKAAFFRTPRHQGAHRRAFITASVAVLSLCVLVVAILGVSDERPPPLLSLMAIAGACTAGFSLAALAYLSQPRLGGLFGFLPLLIWAFVLFGLHTAFSDSLSAFWWGWVACGTVAAGVLYACLRSAHLSRRLCNTEFIGLFDSFNVKRVKTFRARALARKLERRRLAPGQTEFLGRVIRRAETAASRRGRLILLALVESLSIWRARQVLAFTALIVVLTIVYSYLPFGGPGTNRAVNMMLLMPVIVGTAMPLPLYNRLLVPVSRAERGVMAGAVITIWVLMCLALGAALCGSSPYLQDILPVLQIGKGTLEPRTVSPDLWFLAPFAAAVGFALQAILNHQFVRMFIGMAVMMTSGMWVAHVHLPWVAGGALVAVILIVAVAAAYVRCRRACLV